MKPLLHERKAIQSPEAGLTKADVEALLASRKAMLRSLRGDISTVFQDTLRKKIEYEYTYLLHSAAHHAQILETQKNLLSALRPEYFIQKRLDLNAL
mgnify:CR=1 FL=1